MFVGADMGSVDIGPYYLGSGLGDEDDEVVHRDLGLVVLPALDQGIPVIIGSAGSAGGRPHLERTLRTLDQVLRGASRRARVAWVDTELSDNTVLQALAAGRIRACGDERVIPELTSKSIVSSVRLVAQMGVETFMEALDTGADIVVAGRAVDSAIFEAIPLMRGHDRGSAGHMGKTIECTSLCAVPGGRDAVMGTLGDGFFEVESMHPDRNCTAQSLAAHGLYEQADPFEIAGPGGRVDLRNVVYESLPGGRARASGAAWIPADDHGYELKIEGVRWTGHRYQALGGIRCPRGVAQAQASADAIVEMVKELLPAGIHTDDYRLAIRLLGAHGVMGSTEPRADEQPREVYFLIESLSEDRQLAARVCGLARYNLLHYFYPGILATGGNLALGSVPSEVYVGDAYEWSAYHLLRCEPDGMFSINTDEMGSR